MTKINANKKPITLLEARDEFGNYITNKLDLYMNSKWNQQDNNIDLDNFAYQIGSSIIWIAYLLECDKTHFYKELEDSLKNNTFDNLKIQSIIKVAFIDFSEKFIYKFKNNCVDEYEINKGNILFGEIELT
jgi:hypothetical protein